MRIKITNASARGETLTATVRSYNASHMTISRPAGMALMQQVRASSALVTEHSGVRFAIVAPFHRSTSADFKSQRSGSSGLLLQFWDQLIASTKSVSIGAFAFSFALAISEEAGS